MPGREVDGIIRIDNNLSEKECLAELKKNYDGYHFSEDTVTDVYNPFSLLNAFSDLRFGSYWFSTGTPSFLTRMIRDGKVDAFMERINNIFASAPRSLCERNDLCFAHRSQQPTNQKQYELNCQAFVWLIFKLMGEFILCEVQNGKGRSDAVIWQKDIIYVFEFKMDGSAKDALGQIDGKDYLIAYKNDGRKIVKIGVNYSSADRQLTEWIVG